MRYEWILCVCVCVCVCEREGGREGRVLGGACMCVCARARVCVGGGGVCWSGNHNKGQS